MEYVEDQTVIMPEHVKLGMFLDVPKRKRLLNESLNILLAIQAAICCFSAVVVIGWPNCVRSLLTDNATAKCERLSGCGLTDCLFQIIGCSLLCGSSLAILALSFKDAEAKSAVAKFFLSLYVATSFVILKDRNAGVYNSLVFTSLLPWMGIMAIFYILLIRKSSVKKQPRSPEPRCYE